jgi:hypothetical protein
MSECSVCGWDKSKPDYELGSHKDINCSTKCLGCGKQRPAWLGPTRFISPDLKPTQRENTNFPLKSAPMTDKVQEAADEAQDEIVERLTEAQASAIASAHNAAIKERDERIERLEKTADESGDEPMNLTDLLAAHRQKAEAVNNLMAWWFDGGCAIEANSPQTTAHIAANDPDTVLALIAVAEAAAKLDRCPFCDKHYYDHDEACPLSNLEAVMSR